MVRISEIHADGCAAKTYLVTLGNSDLDLLPHEVVGCAFLVDYRRHCHDAFLLLAIAIWLRGSQLSRANSSAHAELSSIDMLPRAAIGLTMVAAANLVEVAALVGDTARATMLNALMHLPARRNTGHLPAHLEIQIGRAASYGFTEAFKAYMDRPPQACNALLVVKVTRRLAG